MDFLPCPFCGSEETRTYRPMQVVGSNYEIAMCGRCGCSGPRGKDCRGEDEQGESAREAAIAVWNKRAPTAAQKLLWACKTALKAIQHQGGGDPRPHGSEEEWDEIEAAIAEAEGRPLPPAEGRPLPPAEDEED